MATQAQRNNYARKRSDATRKLRDRGRKTCFGVRAKGDKPYDPSRKFVAIADAFVFPLGDKRNFVAEVRDDDLMFMVSADNDLSQARIMIDGGHEYAVIELKPFIPDDMVIFYEVLVRG